MKGLKLIMSKFLIRELGSETWPDFARIVEKHNGVWGGCWCVSFHFKSGLTGRTTEQNREYKEKLVRSDKSHAALVYDGQNVVGWCQFGPPAELPGRMSGYGKLNVDPPDWRIPCFFVDKDRRKEGIAKTALEGALHIIAANGGGIVDAYPTSHSATQGKTSSSSFLWSGTVSMFAGAGFSPLGPLGPKKMLMRRTVGERTEYGKK